MIDAIKRQIAAKVEQCLFTKSEVEVTPSLQDDSVMVHIKLPSEAYIGFPLVRNMCTTEGIESILASIASCITDPTKGEVSDQDRMDKVDTFLGLMKELMEDK